MLVRHGKQVGRHYAGRVTQVISGSIGYDDWEWGVDLFADEQGRLQAIELNGRAVRSIEALHQEVEQLVGNDPALAAATEAHLACDEALAYEHTIAAVTAVTGTLLPSGEIQPLAGKVRFVASPEAGALSLA